jgi:abhydrolase domain-containing protein 6
MGSKIIKIIFGFLVLGAVLIIVAVWMVWKRPLTVDAWMSRMALKINGLESGEVVTDAGRMSVWEGGSGPTLVLLHGAGDQAGAWARTVGGLVTDYRVVIPDLPGHWKSDPRSGPIHMEQLLDGVERVMDAYCPDEPVVIVGNSLGAWLGFLYARANPERVARLVAVNGGPLFEPDPQVNLFPTTRDEARETMKGLMGPASPPIPGYVLDDIVRRTTTGPAARFAATAGEMGFYLLDGRLGEVTVPVELVWGAADQLLTVEYAERMLDGLPRARLHLINGCGHVPQRECPIRFLEVLTGALEEPPPPLADETEGDDTADDATTESARNQQAENLLHNGGLQAGCALYDGAGALWGRHLACHPEPQAVAASRMVTWGWA